MRRPLALALAALLLAVAVPSASAATPRVPKQFFGAMWDRAGTLASQPAQDEQWSLMARSGVGSARAVFSWRNAQPGSGKQTSFAYTDALAARAARNGIDLLPVVLETPRWARRYPERGGSPPARNADFTRYLTALVARYGPKGSFWTQRPDLPRRPIRYWQVWNEPHFDEYWYAPGTSWPRPYAALLKDSYRAIKRADPGARVVLAGLADFSWRHLKRLNRSKIQRYFDVAAINLFTAKPRNVIRGLGFVRRTMRRGKEGRKPVWLTESTWPASKGRVKRDRGAIKRWGNGWESSDAGMARKLSAFYSLAARNRKRLRLQRVYWYTWASGYETTDRFDYGGLVRFDGGTFQARPALSAYAKSSRKLAR